MKSRSEESTPYAPDEAQLVVTEVIKPEKRYERRNMNNLPFMKRKKSSFKALNVPHKKEK